MSGASNFILITGATGFIGIKVLQVALQPGYSVRAAVPVRGVKYIVHVACPVPEGRVFPPEQWEHDLVEPAVKGTSGILEAALKEPEIERIVIISSEAAIIPWEDFFVKEVNTVFDDQHQFPEPSGPYANCFEAYAAGKARALNATKAFVAEHKPKWDVVNILPAFVIGENELATKADDLLHGTNEIVLAQALGLTGRRGAVPSTSVHVTDVAKLHILALDPKIPGGQNFLAVSEGERGTRWNECHDVIKRNFGKAVATGILPNNGHVPTKRTKLDASQTEKLFGIKFLSYEEQVKSMVGQYLSLLGFVV